MKIINFKKKYEKYILVYSINNNEFVEFYNILANRK